MFLRFFHKKNTRSINNIGNPRLNSLFHWCQLLKNIFCCFLAPVIHLTTPTNICPTNPKTSWSHLRWSEFFSHCKSNSERKTRWSQNSAPIVKEKSGKVVSSFLTKKHELFKRESRILTVNAANTKYELILKKTLTIYVAICSHLLNFCQ